MAQRPTIPGLRDRPDTRAEGLSPTARSAEIGVEHGMPAETVAATIPLGGRVHDVIASPEGERIYVAGSDQILVFNGQHHIVARVPHSGQPKSLAIDATGKRLFVVHHGGEVSVLDTGDHTVRTLPNVWDLDAVPSRDGRYLYTACRPITGTDGGSVIMVIDIASATTVAELSVVGDVAGLAMSPDGGRLYVVSYDGRTYYQYPAGWLTVIDTAGPAIVDILAVDPCPETVTVSPDGDRLSITHYDTSSVSAIDLTTGNVTTVTLPHSPLSVEFTPDGAHAYVTTVRSLAVIDTATHELEDIATGDLPRGVRLSPDGKRAYVTNFGDHTLSVVDTITNSVSTTVDVARDPEAVAITADGDRVYLGHYWPGIVTVISIPTVRDRRPPA
jgi:YVTN family beta-propeller protein